MGVWVFCRVYEGFLDNFEPSSCCFVFGHHKPSASCFGCYDLRWSGCICHCVLSVRQWISVCILYTHFNIFKGLFLQWIWLSALICCYQWYMELHISVLKYLVISYIQKERFIMCIRSNSVTIVPCIQFMRVCWVLKIPVDISLPNVNSCLWVTPGTLCCFLVLVLWLKSTLVVRLYLVRLVRLLLLLCRCC